MKNRITPLVFLAMAAMALVDCSGPQTPREAAEGYLAALARRDFEGASRFVADDGQMNFTFLKKLYEDLSPEEQKKFDVTTWEVVSETTNGDTATVDFLFDTVKKGQLSLQKVKGQWKVDHRQTF